MNKKVKTARLSIFSNMSLILMKLFVGIFTGSVSIISEAIHSSMDLLASFIAYYSVRISDTPADKEHPYGHGKFENVSGVAEAILIFIASFWIIYEAVNKMISPHEVTFPFFGVLVMVISAVVNIFISRKLYKVAKETDSVALEADALHLKTDVYTSVGVGAGIFLIWITGYTILDPIVAMIVALFILREAYILLRNAFFPLVDSAMADSEIKIIKNVLDQKSLRFHDLKTRKAGQYRFAELHLEMPEHLLLKEVHLMCDEVENELKSQIKNLEINIHVEPYSLS